MLFLKANQQCQSTEGRHLQWQIPVEMNSRQKGLGKVKMAPSLFSNDISSFNNTTYHTDTRLMTLCPGLPGWAGTRKVKPIWIYWSKRQWVAVASAGPYANLHLAPGINHASTPPLHQIFVHDNCGGGSVLLWWHCNTLCISGFVDDVVFAQWSLWCIVCIPNWRQHNSQNYCIDSKQILLNDKDHQYTLWVVHWDKLCYLQLPCLCIGTKSVSYNCLLN